MNEAMEAILNKIKDNNKVMLHQYQEKESLVVQLNEQIKVLKLEKQQKDMCINSLKESLKKQDVIKTHLYNSLKEADQTICELCKEVNPQHATMNNGKGCTTCRERESRLQILVKAEEL